MKQYKLTSFWRQASMTLLFATLSTVVTAQNPNFHIYLAFGGSNMEGQGNIQSQDKTKYDNFKVLWSSTNFGIYNETRQTGEWYTAVAPLAHKDAKLSVAIDLYLNENVSVGYCAVVSGLSEEAFIQELGKRKISIFRFGSDQSFLESCV